MGAFIALLTFLIVALGYAVLFVVFVVLRVLPNKYFYPAIRWVYSQVFAQIWATLFRGFNKLNVVVTGDKIDKDDCVLVVSNHAASLDILVIEDVATKYGPMPGFVRFIAKKAIAYVPFAGWCHWLIGDVFLKRKWESDQKVLRKTAEGFVRSGNKWMVIFPEGTRASTKGKVEASNTFAAQRGLPPLKYCLYPRPKGFAELCAGFKKGGAKYLYDFTICYPVEDPLQYPTTYKVFSGGNTMKIVVHCKKILLSSIPDDEQGMSDWLTKCMQEKDRTLRTWVESGFTTTS